jgi:hypothetical protein
VTLSGLAWQLWLYRLSGARLKVQIVFCWAEDSIRTWSVSYTRKPILFEHNVFEHPSSFGIEYGRVRVTNVGRTAVSVENISFDIARRWWQPRRNRQTIQPRQFRPKDAEPKTPDTVDLGKPIRLEPGDNVTADLHLWPALAGPESGTRAGSIRVRGSALAVGRRWATRSSRRTAWRLPAGAWTIFRDVEVTPELRVFRELWQYNQNGNLATSIALLMYREINKLLTEGATHEELKSYLDKHTQHLDEPWANGIVAYDVHHAFHHEAPALRPESRPSTRRSLSIFRTVQSKGSRFKRD